jgi:predicted amidohydrolase YtcJ
VRTLYRNGRIYSSAAREPTAMLIEDGIIAWIGQDDVAGPHRGEQHRGEQHRGEQHPGEQHPGEQQPGEQHGGVVVVNLDGAFVTPAFVDAHLHATATGLALTSLDLSSTTSLAQALAAVERAARVGRGRPILGTGWDESGWPEQRAPTAAELDRAAYGGSVYLARVDAHSAVVSSVLAAAVPGLANRPGYSPDGWLSGDAHDAVRTAAFAALSPAQRREAQRAALQRAASLGIGCVHEMAGPAISGDHDLLSVLAVSKEEPLPEVIGYWGELFGIDAALELGAVGAGGDLFCDGSLGSHTAALGEPYADRPDSAGRLRFATADLVEHIRRCASAGLQAGFHAIGDAAVDQVLDAVDLVSARVGHAGGAAHRIEHAEMVRDPARLAGSGLIASMQPAFDSTWGGPAGMYAHRLGPARALKLNRFAELAAAGVPLAFGSDAPVTPLGPWAAVRAAAHPSDPAAAISPRAAFTAHTRGGWRAAGRDGEGVLAPGAPATFAVWCADGLGVDVPDERVSRWSTDPQAAVPGLPDLAPGAGLPACQRTVVRGEVIFTAN